MASTWKYSEEDRAFTRAVVRAGFRQLMRGRILNAYYAFKMAYKWRRICLVIEQKVRDHYYV